MKKYYKICTRHMGDNDATFLFWRESSGYTRFTDSAFVYSESELNKDYLIKNNKNDFYVEKMIVDSLSVEYEFDGTKQKVFPNLGQNRKAIGITILDICLSDRKMDHIYLKYEETHKEVFREDIVENCFDVSAKPEYFDEFWNYSESFHATNRNQAITAAYVEWGMRYEDVSYIDFKKMVSCSKSRVTVFDDWVCVA